MPGVRTVVLGVGVLVGAALAPAAAIDPASIVLVACAPGYPGSTEEAQPRMDALAAIVSEATGWGPAAVGAVYHESEDRGLARLAQPDAAVALVPLPFFLKHEASLKLAAVAQAVPTGTEAAEIWSLVAGRGRVRTSGALDGMELLSTAGYAPAFVRAAVAAWGRVPPDTRIAPSVAILSGLRRAANGEPVALLLDAAQTRGMTSLPFAARLEVVARSQPLPAALVCIVGGRLPAARTATLVGALTRLHDRPAWAAALNGVQLTRFNARDERSLARARDAYRAALP